MTKKKSKKDSWYDSSSYTSPMASRLERNSGYETDSRYAKFRDKPVKPAKVTGKDKIKKKTNRMVD